MIATREYKATALDEFEVDYRDRTIQGYFATWDMDRVGDTIDPKAFDETFRERGPVWRNGSFQGSKIKIDFNHKEIVGVPTLLDTDSVGAYFHGRIDKTPQGDMILERVRNKSLDVNSFQYDVLGYDRIHGGIKERIDGGYTVSHERHLTKLRVHFVGPVDAACNESAVLTGMKAIWGHRLARKSWESQSEFSRRVDALLRSLKALDRQRATERNLRAKAAVLLHRQLAWNSQRLGQLQQQHYRQYGQALPLAAFL